MSQKSDPHEVPGQLGPLFGRTDPPTSRAAAAKMEDFGTLTHDQAFAEWCVREFPGKTAKEMAAEICRHTGEARLEWVRQRIGRRLNELEKAGLIRRDGERDGCSIWWPV